MSEPNEYFGSLIAADLMSLSVSSLQRRRDAKDCAMFVYIKGVKISDRRIKNISRDNCARHENKIISFVKCVKPEDKQMKIPVFLLLLSISMQSTSICAADKKIPKDILLKIEAKAAIDFPNDHSKQVKVTKSQIKAYEEIKNYKNNNVSAKSSAFQNKSTCQFVHKARPTFHAFLYRRHCEMQKAEVESGRKRRPRNVLLGDFRA
jgi:hypothetical protein